MTTAADATARPRWQRLLLQLALSVPELAVAAGLGFAIFTATMLLGCRALSPACDSTGGLVVVVAGPSQVSSQRAATGSQRWRSGSLVGTARATRSMRSSQQ